MCTVINKNINNGFKDLGDLLMENEVCPNQPFLILTRTKKVFLKNDLFYREYDVKFEMGEIKLKTTEAVKYYLVCNGSLDQPDNDYWFGLVKDSEKNEFMKKFKFINGNFNVKDIKEFVCETLEFKE